MSTKPFAAICTGALLAAAAWGQEAAPVRDPLRDYLNDFETSPDEELISSQVDLNGDAVDDLFLSRSSLANGRQGFIWVFYESLPAGQWRRHDTLDGNDGGVIEFHPKAVSVQADGKGGKMLIRYSPGGASTGRLTTFQLRNGGVVESVRAGEIQPEDTHAPLYEQYFGNPKTSLMFQSRNMAELRSKYLPFGGWFHEITAGKLVFLGLCLFVPLWFLRKILQLSLNRRRGENG